MSFAWTLVRANTSPASEMRTPAGKECRYFYGDYYRGRNREECRLLKDSGLSWNPRLCNACPVPEITRHNGCEHLVFAPTLKRPLGFLPAQVQLTTACTRCNCSVAKPQIGCGQCHGQSLTFVIAPDDPDTAA